MVNIYTLAVAFIGTLLATNPVSASKTPAKGTWQYEVLSRTNYHRHHHGAPSLHWDNTMAAFAQAHVNKCVFQHSGGPYGENIWAQGSSGSSAPDLPGNAPVDSWYSEVKYYNWSKPGVLTGPQGQEIGHFTALVWVASSHLGCAKASCPKGTIWSDFTSEFVSCNYKAPGNMYGPNNDVSYFVKNVLQYR